MLLFCLVPCEMLVVSEPASPSSPPSSSAGLSSGGGVKLYSMLSCTQPFSMYSPGTRSEKSQYLIKASVVVKHGKHKRVYRVASKRAHAALTCCGFCQCRAAFCAGRGELWLCLPGRLALRRPSGDGSALLPLLSPCALPERNQKIELSIRSLFYFKCLLPLFCLSISSFSFLACMDISRRLFTVLTMSSGSGSTLTSFLIFSLELPSFFFSP